MSPRQANGYVLNVAPARRETLLDGEWPAEPVDEFKHSGSHPLVCFVSFADGAITHLALGRQGVRAGTGPASTLLDDLERRIGGQRALGGCSGSVD